MIIRQVEIIDAEQLMNLIAHVESTSDFMLLEAGERNNSVKNKARKI